MGALDLVSLADLQAWTGTIGNATALSTLISKTSHAILSSLNRGSILPLTYNETYDGYGGERLFLQNWPVIAVDSLAVNGEAIPAAPAWVPGQAWQRGYVISPQNDPSPPGIQQEIALRGYRFWRGVQNILVSYSGGYQVTDDNQIIPSNSSYLVAALAPYGEWASDQGVLINGVAATAVASTPSAGQYSVSAGVYTFAAANAGEPVSLTYGYIPADLALACLQIAGEYLAYQAHPGVTSKSLGGQEAISFNNSVLTNMVAQNGLLQPYRRVVPL